MGEFVELRVRTWFFLWLLNGHKLWWSSGTGVDRERAQSPELPSQLKGDACL